MAKKFVFASDEKKVFKTPSLYGSHRSMVCDDTIQNVLLGEERIANGEIVLSDSEGSDAYYITTVNRLDTGLADPNRYGNLSSRIL